MVDVARTLRRPVGRFTGRSLAGLVLVLGAGVGFGALLVLVRTGWAPLYEVDHGVSAWLNEQVSPHPPVVTVLNALTDLGGLSVLFWLVSVSVVGLLVRRQGRLAVYLVVTGAGALVLDPTLKTMVDRLRPEVAVPVGSYAGQSFPSGHALGAMVAYGSLLLVFLPAMAPRWRRLAIVATASLVVLVGVTRVALSVHFVSDVIGAWLLGAAWLGVTAYAFRLWRLERGRPVVGLGEGLEPEAAPHVAPAPDEERILPRPRADLAELIIGWVLVLGLLYGFGSYVSYHAAGSPVAALDQAVPAWFAERRTPWRDEVSYWWSRAGDTHAILLVCLVFCPLVVAVWRRWRPVVFVALTMLGELGLFLATSAAVDRPRPAVENLDGPMPTSSFPSGHIAATLCLWVAITVVVWPRTDRWWRWLLVALAVVMPLGVAISRMYRGMHHPGDVLGAVLLTTCWVGLLCWVVRPNADVDGGNRPAVGFRDHDRVDQRVLQ